MLHSFVTIGQILPLLSLPRPIAVNVVDLRFHIGDLMRLMNSLVRRKVTRILKKLVLLVQTLQPLLGELEEVRRVYLDVVSIGARQSWY